MADVLDTWGPHVLPLRPIVEGDQIIYHRHWAILVRGIGAPLFFFVVVFLAWVYLVLPGAYPAVWPKGIGLQLLIVAISLFPLAWLLWRYENWRNDYYVVARDRIIDVNRLPLGFGAEIREALLGNVQNISMKIPNLVAASLNYGDIEVDTAGRQGQLVFQSIHHPREVLKEVASRVEAYREERARIQRNQQEEDTLNWFSIYADLGRISIVRSPAIAKYQESVEIEWQVSGPSADIQTRLFWDTHPCSRQGYAYGTSWQKGNIGSYKDAFVCPEAGSLYLRALARIEGKEYWTQEHEIPVIYP